MNQEKLNINNEEMKLLEELYTIRIMDSHLEDEDEMQEDIEDKIDRYEVIVFNLMENKNIDLIPKLCDIAEDKATELSAVKYLIDNIFNLALNNEKAMERILEGIPFMVPKALRKASYLIRQIILNKNTKEILIKDIENIKDITIKESLITILKELSKIYEDKEIKGILQLLGENHE